MEFGIAYKDFFLYIGIRHCLDAEFQKIGIHFASKCNCCRQPNMESADHLFFHNDISKAGWNWISNTLSFQAPRNWNEVLSWILLSLTKESRYVILKRLLTAACCGKFGNTETSAD